MARRTPWSTPACDLPEAFAGSKNVDLQHRKGYEAAVGAGLQANGLPGRKIRLQASSHSGPRIYVYKAAPLSLMEDKAGSL